MEMRLLLAEIDEELNRLKQARALLAGTSDAKPAAATKKKTGRRKMSAEGRARIVAAQKKRWAAQRKSK